jgi:hypothetical protein
MGFIAGVLQPAAYSKQKCTTYSSKQQSTSLSSKQQQWKDDGFGEEGQTTSNNKHGAWQQAEAKDHCFPLVGQ